MTVTVNVTGGTKLQQRCGSGMAIKIEKMAGNETGEGRRKDQMTILDVVMYGAYKNV